MEDEKRDEVESEPLNDRLDDSSTKLEYDKGWAWMVLLGAFSATFIVNWQVVNYGLFLVEIQSMTGCSASAAAWIGLANFVTMMFLAPFADMLSVRYTTRPVVMLGGLIMTLARAVAAFCTTVQMFTLFLGLIDGIGAGLAYVPSIIFLGQYFKRRIGLANGILFTNMGIALLISMPVTSTSFTNMGLNGTLLLQASITAHCCLAGAVLFPRKDNSTTPNEKTTLLNKKPLREKIVQNLMKAIPRDIVQIQLIIAFSFIVLCQVSVPKYIPPLNRDLNISRSETAWMMTTSGLADILGRMLIGIVCDLKVTKTYIKIYRLWGCGITIMGVCYALYPSMKNYESMFVNTMVCTFAVAVIMTAAPLVCLEQMGLLKFGRTYTLMMMGASFFNFADILVVAKLRDVTGTYYTSFYFLSGVALTAALVTFLQQCTLQYRHKPHQSTGQFHKPVDMEL